jgi:hypothetical protein
LAYPPVYPVAFASYYKYCQHARGELRFYKSEKRKVKSEDTDIKTSPVPQKQSLSFAFEKEEGGNRAEFSPRLAETERCELLSGPHQSGRL